ncbi:MAG: type VI secretion system tube protein Hcp [Gemmatirosa sp.]|nr:type VI secretion system tube protein Hcp [Gemmatirosa sp.]
MPFDTFIDIATVEGESTATGFEKKIEIYSFSWGASNPVTVGSGSGGMSSGKVSISSFNIMKKTDKSSTTLFQACATGHHFDTATVTMRKATGNAGGQKAFLVYKFTEVMVESIQWSGSSGGDDTPTESVSLAFGKVEVEYFGQDPKGAVKPLGQAAWDLTKVTK